MSRTRGLAVVACLVLAASSTLTLGELPAGAAKASSGTVSCRNFDSTTEVPDPTSWSLSGCNRPPVTGRSGTPVQTSQTADGTTLVIDWSTGQTTTIFLNAQTTPTATKGCHFKKHLGPHVSQTAYVQPGSVTADTTGSIKVAPFTVTICAQSNNLVPVTSTWNAKRFTF
jgi:hypothetical protein